MAIDDEPLPYVSSDLTPTVGLSWGDLSLATRYQRLTRIASGLVVAIEAAAESDEFVEAVLELRDFANQILNGGGEFAYLSPADCWERNLPLSAIGWRYPGTIGDS
jgi:hypothetical protein